MKRIWTLVAVGLVVVAVGCSTKKDIVAQPVATGEGETEMVEVEPIITEVDVAPPVSRGPSSSQINSRLRDIHFEYDKALIRDTDKPVLLANAELLKNNPNVQVVVEGHCDERGTTAYNLALGAQRAAATRRYLVALGVSGSQISTVSYGEERPVCHSADESCWSRNRRGHTTVR